jgi:hypothetical protein
VVIPTNRPDELTKWTEAWRPYLEGVALYVVHDDADTWARIDAALGEDAWIIPRRTDCIRSWGYLLAHRDGAEYTITLDDDCYPHGDAFAEHVRALTTPVEPVTWGRTIPDLMTRGLPRTRTVAINHGLWTGIPDLAGRDQLSGYGRGWTPAYPDE